MSFLRMSFDVVFPPYSFGRGDPVLQFEEDPLPFSASTSPLMSENLDVRIIGAIIGIIFYCDQALIHNAEFQQIEASLRSLYLCK